MKVIFTVYRRHADYVQYERKLETLDDIFQALEIASMFADKDVYCIGVEFEYEGSSFELKKTVPSN